MRLILGQLSKLFPSLTVVSRASLSLLVGGGKESLATTRQRLVTEVKRHLILHVTYDTCGKASETGQ